MTHAHRPFLLPFLKVLTTFEGNVGTTTDRVQPQRGIFLPHLEDAKSTDDMDVGYCYAYISVLDKQCP